MQLRKSTADSYATHSTTTSASSELVQNSLSNSCANSNHGKSATNQINKNNNNVTSAVGNFTIKDEVKQRLSVRRSSRIDHHHYHHNHILHITPRGRSKLSNCCKVDQQPVPTVTSSNQNQLPLTNLLISNASDTATTKTMASTRRCRRLNQFQSGTIFATATTTTSRSPLQDQHLQLSDSDSINGNTDINLELQKQSTTGTATIQKSMPSQRSVLSSNISVKRAKRSLSSTRVEKEKTENTKVLRKACLRNSDKCHLVTATTTNATVVAPVTTSSSTTVVISTLNNSNFVPLKNSSSVNTTNQLTTTRTAADTKKNIDLSSPADVVSKSQQSMSLRCHHKR